MAIEMCAKEKGGFFMGMGYTSVQADGRILRYPMLGALSVIHHPLALLTIGVDVL